MSRLPGFLFLGLIVAVVIASAVIGGLFDARRTRALRDLAQRLGLRFLGHSFEEYARAPQLETALFQGRFGKEVRNILAGHRGGFTVSFFDYAYGRGRRRGSTEQTVAAFTQGLPLPQFELLPRRVLSNVDERTFQEEIRFEDRPEFSQRFRLVGPDKDKVRELFTPGRLAFWESLDPKTRWHLEGAGFTHVSRFIYHFGNKVNPEEYPEFVDEATRIATGFLGASGLIG